MKAARRRVYLDWNATTPLAPEAAQAMRALLDDLGGGGLNPSSQHAEGRAARGRLEAARRDVAALVGAAPGEILFTGSASEAAATVLAQDWDVVFVSAIEHDCVRAAAARSGAAVVEIAVGADGVTSAAALERALAQAPAKGRRLVATMAANNETGAIQPVAELTRVAQAAGAAMLVDAAQAAGKAPVDLRALGADYAILSAHKLQGPTGVGALFLADASAEAARFRPLIAGGGQELRRRAGTENLLGAVGFGAAARAAADPARRAAWAEAALRRDRMEARLKNVGKGLVFFAAGVHRLPTTSCVALPHVSAELQLMRLDLAGFAVSAGSACSSGKMAPSHVLRAMGADETIAARAIRVSFGPETPEADLEAFAEAYGEMAAGGRL